MVFISCAACRYSWAGVGVLIAPWNVLACFGPGGYLRQASQPPQFPGLSRWLFLSVLYSFLLDYWAVGE